jgi:hypothetical protein
MPTTVTGAVLALATLGNAIQTKVGSGNPYPKGRISTFDLLELTSLDQLIFKMKKYFPLYYKTSYLNEEVNRTEPSPSGWCSLIVSICIVPLRASVTVSGMKKDRLGRFPE